MGLRKRISVQTKIVKYSSRISLVFVIALWITQNFNYIIPFIIFLAIAIIYQISVENLENKLNED
jgi:hypothetical protein